MKRVPRLLLIAFALSLIVHLIVAMILRPPLPTPQSQAEVVSIERRPATIAVTKVVTPPPPPPKRTPAPRSVSSAPPRSRKGEAAAAGGSGTAPPQTPPPPAPTPSPAASVAGACSQPNADAAVAVSPSPPDITPEARTEGTSGVALVRVQLDENGQVTGAGVAQSTGNSSLDLVAVAMAREARYTPALHDCKPVAGAYTFSVKFFAW
jgi:periplasmic protein TonB